jgi:hypothetical protein
MKTLSARASARELSSSLAALVPSAGMSFSAGKSAFTGTLHLSAGELHSFAGLFMLVSGQNERVSGNGPYLWRATANASS